jgi:hypothetical protein
MDNNPFGQIPAQPPQNNNNNNSVPIGRPQNLPEQNQNAAAESMQQKVTETMTNMFGARPNGSRMSMSVNGIPIPIIQNNTPGSHSGLAIAALVLGIVGILGCAIPILNIFSIVLGVLAVIFGGMAIFQTFKKQKIGKIMAIIGTVLGALTIILFFASYAALGNWLTKNGVKVDVNANGDSSVIDDMTSGSSDIDAINNKISDSIMGENGAKPMTKADVTKLIGSDPKCEMVDGEESCKYSDGITITIGEDGNVNGRMYVAN